MKKLDRYIISELFIPFVVGTIAFALLFQVSGLINDSSKFTSVPNGAMLLIQYILYKTPASLKMTIPIGVALASSLAISRLVRESELAAFRSAGISIARVIRPVVWVGLFAAIGDFCLTEYVMPNTEKKANIIMKQVDLMGSGNTAERNVITMLKKYVASFGVVTRTAKNKVMLQEILLIERISPTEVKYYTSTAGLYHKGEWIFYRPYCRTFYNHSLVNAEFIPELKYYEPVKVSTLFINDQNTTPEELGISKLLRSIDEGKRLKRNVTRLEVSLHDKFAIPAACIIFGLTGPLFAIWFAKGGAFIGVQLSIMLVMLYYNSYVVCTEILAPSGIVSAWLGAWLTNFIFLAYGVFAMRRAE